MSLKAINLLHLIKRGKKRYCAKKNSRQNILQYSLQKSLQYSLEYSQTILISMALVYLLSLSSMFVYFWHITLLRLKIKNLSMKNRIKHQNDVICFRKIYTINE